MGIIDHAACCPMCLSRFTVHTVLVPKMEPREPLPGDFTICERCGTWLRYMGVAPWVRAVDANDIAEMSDKDRQILSKLTDLILLVRS